MERTIVISAVNLVDGGTFTILQDCLSALSESQLSTDYRVVALVHSKNELPRLGIEYIEYPNAKTSYFNRLYYEYIGFKKLSRKLKPQLWLSLHDMSPRVDAGTQAVYMHNPTPFYHPKYKDWKFVPINAVWAYVYKYIYKFNIKSNKYLIVQQQWIRDAFSKMFSFPSDRIIVARPIQESNSVDLDRLSFRQENKKYTFVYPAYPRVFKNFDVVCEAARILEQRVIDKVTIVLTISGEENKYSRYLVNKYSKISILEFRGLVPKSEMNSFYSMADCLLFPSKLETWGLPLSEFKPYNKPMIVSDLPYAHESVAGASMVSFFNPDSAEELANQIESLVNGNASFFHSIPDIKLKEPRTESWEELFRVLLNGFA